MRWTGFPSALHAITSVDTSASQRHINTETQQQQGGTVTIWGRCDTYGAGVTHMGQLRFK